jgi:hypothetical protein
MRMGETKPAELWLCNRVTVVKTSQDGDCITGLISALFGLGVKMTMDRHTRGVAPHSRIKRKAKGLERSNS